MGMKRKPREELIEELNSAFSEKQVRNTAKRLRALPERAELGKISETLGLIPKQERARFRKSSGRVPVLIASALAQGVRAHLRTVNRTRTTRYAGPKAIRFNIQDGPNFGLEIRQLATHTALTLTMRNKPFGK